ncbi:hypothetical protein [Actinophytocola sp.]|uniref:hypothetical protein n=1 Tax=Actinophytocola sp. TaxID=1872138 RepID=UPI002D7E4601|nr:hypothetical protein [Actinophytocola sp.]HET9144324.1 hypothetical protein [Actinophytocola sp.]
MTESEDRLRAGLAELAERVPPSEDAWAEHRRRLTARPQPDRRPVLAVASVAVVVAALLIGSVLARSNRTAESGQSSPATASANPSGFGAPVYPDASVDRGPFDLGVFTVGNTHWRASTFVDLSRELPRVCVVIAPINSAAPTPNDPPAPPPDCAPLRGGGKLESRAVRAATVPVIGPMPGKLLFLTVPQVATLDVCAGDGTPAAVTELARTDALVLYVADFPAGYEGFCFTAKDSAGEVVSAGIT